MAARRTRIFASPSGRAGAVARVCAADRSSPAGRIAFQTLVDALDEPAAVIDERFCIVAANAHYREKFAGGRPVCGDFCHTWSHASEIPCADTGQPCPIQHSRITGTLTRALHVHHTSNGAEYEEVSVQPLLTPGAPTFYLERLHTTQVAHAVAAPRGLVGSAPAFSRMLELLTRVARSDSTVLLLGESGTGKELLARALHDASNRAERPFVPVDCSGLSESLFESELFGHERGAFTGAVDRKRGLCEAAHRGTLFLDEVGDIPAPQQVKLLRLIETNTFRRVGGVEQMRCDFRLVCATHRNLAAMVSEGSFRRDLYYRISAFPIQLPPLRERAADIPLLVNSFLQLESCRHVRRVSDDAMARLRAYPYPGNVRELRNVVERACLLVDGDTLLAEHLPEEMRSDGNAPEPVLGLSDLVPLANLEDQYLRWAVAHFKGDRAALARKLGISERTLYRRINEAHRRSGRP